MTYQGQTKRVKAATGDLIDLRHGYGVYEYQNGLFKYEGMWKDNVKHGKGKLVLCDGSVIYADFENGEIHGHGRREWRDGSWYEGDFVAGHMEGQGQLVRSDKTTYVGAFVANRRHGYGRLTRPDGSMFAGTFAENQPDGNGQDLSADGRLRFEGKFAAGKRHGLGEFLWYREESDRTATVLLRGEWVQGQLQGDALWRHEGAQLEYKGPWEDDVPVEAPECIAVMVPQEPEEEDKPGKGKKKPKKGKKGKEPEPEEPPPPALVTEPPGFQPLPAVEVVEAGAPVFAENAVLWCSTAGFRRSTAESGRRLRLRLVRTDEVEAEAEEEEEALPAGGLVLLAAQETEEEQDEPAAGVFELQVTVTNGEWTDLCRLAVHPSSPADSLWTLEISDVTSGLHDAVSCGYPACSQLPTLSYPLTVSNSKKGKKAKKKSKAKKRS